MTEHERFVTDLYLAERYDVHRGTIWRWLKLKDFPQPKKLSPGCSRWYFPDILKWEDQAKEGK